MHPLDWGKVFELGMLIEETDSIIIDYFTLWFWVLKQAAELATETVDASLI